MTNPAGERVVPVYDFPESAVAAMNAAARYGTWRATPAATRERSPSTATRLIVCWPKNSPPDGFRKRCGALARRRGHRCRAFDGRIRPKKRPPPPPHSTAPWRSKSRSRPFCTKPTSAACCSTSSRRRRRRLQTRLAERLSGTASLSRGQRDADGQTRRGGDRRNHERPRIRPAGRLWFRRSAGRIARRRGLSRAADDRSRRRRDDRETRAHRLLRGFRGSPRPTWRRSNVYSLALGALAEPRRVSRKSI